MISTNGATAVIGATGFVGQALLSDFARRGQSITAITSPSRAFLLPPETADVIAPVDVGPRRFQTVINLAYPNRGLPHLHAAKNREIVTLIDRLLAPGGTVIHASTLAVFGMSFELPVHAGPAPRVRTDAYVETKADMEYLLGRRLTNANALHIVRLGNVWGPKSAHWTAGLLQRLFFGLPVGVRGSDGFSNVTDIGNVVAYFAFLTTQATQQGTQIHHLAEFSEHRWSEFVSWLARISGCEMVLADEVPSRSTSIGREVLDAIRAGVSPGELARSVWLASRLGSYARSALRSLPRGIMNGIARGGQRLVRAAPPMLASDDASFLRLMSCRQQCHSVVDTRWTPPLTLSASFDRVEAWARAVGFC